MADALNVRERCGVVLTTMERACVPAMWVGWSRGASKGALLELVHGVRAHAKVKGLWS